jgi:hypothetical protein
MKSTFTAMSTNGVELQIEAEPEGVTVSLAGGDEVVLGVDGLAGLEEFLNSSMTTRPHPRGLA